MSMLMEAKKLAKVILKNYKYGLMKCMLNKASFITYILFMMLNNASFLVQWIVIFSFKDNICGLTFKEVILVWGVASGSYGIARFFFTETFNLYTHIINGSLDAYLVQPKNTLLMVATSRVQPSAIGDFIYGYIIFFVVFGLSHPLKFLLFTYILIISGIGYAGLQALSGCVAFFLPNPVGTCEMLQKLTSYATTYPGEIFKFGVQIFCFIAGTGFNVWVPHHLLLDFNFGMLLVYTLVNIFYAWLAFKVFGFGLKKYSSANFMNARC